MTTYDVMRNLRTMGEDANKSPVYRYAFTHPLSLKTPRIQVLTRQYKF